MIDSLSKYRLAVSIGIIWLFHISAIIGISLGNLDWFIEKTPINLGLSLILFLLVYPINTFKKWMALLFFFSGGMFAEWLGVNYQLLFGTYSYGHNFGPKLGGVPYLIGAYWSLLTFICAAILEYTNWANTIKIMAAAGLMVLLDYLMEYNAPNFHFWSFEGGMPHFENYSTWFLLGIIFQAILKMMDIKGNKLFSLNLYLAQFVFFLFFYFKF